MVVRSDLGDGRERALLGSAGILSECLLLKCRRLASKRLGLRLCSSAQKQKLGGLNLGGMGKGFPQDVQENDSHRF